MRRRRRGHGQRAQDGQRQSPHGAGMVAGCYPSRAEDAVSLERALSDVLVRFLTKDVRNYQRRIPNDVDNLRKHIRPGDVLLVEGKTRIAQIIKYITQSSWSH